MDATLKTQQQPATKRSLLTQLIALFVFLLVCGSLALPLLCVGGNVAAAYKTTLVFLIFCRLAWQIHKGIFRFRDYLIYFALAAGFCLWMDSYL